MLRRRVPSTRRPSFGQVEGMALGLHCLVAKVPGYVGQGYVAPEQLEGVSRTPYFSPRLPLTVLIRGAWQLQRNKTPCAHPWVLQLQENKRMCTEAALHHADGVTSDLLASLHLRDSLSLSRILISRCLIWAYEVHT